MSATPTQLAPTELTPESLKELQAKADQAKASGAAAATVVHPGPAPYGTDKGPSPFLRVDA